MPSILLLLFAAGPPEVIDFDKQIAPLLARRCLDCHGSTAPEAKFDLSRVKPPRTMARAMERVLSDEMPPNKPLPADERELLRRWIASGAKWGTDPIDPFAFTTRNRAGRDWWSLQPVRPVPVPGATTGATNPLDQFWLHRLQAARLQPSPEADRRTLIRRVTFDLIGLPPTPDEVRAFLDDHRPDAYERLVNRLLASPRFGERWARHWLDIARYGESDGFERDLPRFSAWPYRDWVINALNADLPYDQFARLQLAADILQPEEIAATGFLVAGAHDIVVPVVETMRASMRQDELEDITGTVAQVFLGLTFQCARCHEHKFDPIHQKDYYRLASALAGVGHGELTVNDGPRRDIAQLRQREAEARRALETLEKPIREKLLATGKGEKPRPLIAWDFRRSLDDETGQIKGRIHGGARRDAEGLHLDGKTGYLTVPLKGLFREKTLEVWVRLRDLDQRGGGVMSMQTPDGSTFDAIVFGEQQPRRWMAGSDHFRRTKSFGGEEEPAAAEVHIAISYTADGTIMAYRNGQPYGTSYRTTPVLFRDPQMVFGLRHTPVGANRMLSGTITRARLYDRALMASIEVPLEKIVAQFTDEQRTRHKTLIAEAESARAEADGLERRAVRKMYAVNSLPTGITHVLHRGNVIAKGEPTAPEVPRALEMLAGPTRLKPDASDVERRRELARWMTAERNPLFARVIINRLWHHHFGIGLVDTPSDFGFNGGRPSHPELLDWLASELIRQGWSLKAMHRLMVTSQIYRQASAPRLEALTKDADNRLLWRKSPIRLEAETIRDAMLATAGELDTTMGGPPYLDFKTYFFKGTQFYDPVEEVSRRRSIYRMWARGGRNPFLDTFDCPDPSTTTPRRAATTTPLQALALLNNSRVLSLSEDLADRLKKERDPIEAAWLRAYGRPPRTDERTVVEVFVRQHGLAALGRVLFNSAEFMQVD